MPDNEPAGASVGAHTGWVGKGRRGYGASREFPAPVTPQCLSLTYLAISEPVSSLAFPSDISVYDARGPGNLHITFLLLSAASVLEEGQSSMPSQSLSQASR